MVYILLGKGFEETEATAPYDILCRGGAEPVFAGVGEKNVVSSHGIGYSAHCLVSDIDLDKAEMIVIPGGLGGVETISRSKEALSVIKNAIGRGIEVAAICAGPSVLYGLGVLCGKNVTCYPGVEENMPEAKAHTDRAVVRDGKITTGRGPGSSLDFGFALLEVLRGKKAADDVAAAMHYDYR